MKRAAMNRLLCVSLSLAAAALTPAITHAAQGDPVAGKDKTAMCAGCHGVPGYKTAFPVTYNVPKLGGQHAGYIVSALQAYKRGDRSHPSMRSIAAGLSDQDMADLGAYYSSTATQSAAK